MPNDSSCANPEPTLLIVLSGPSGVGKDAVLSRLKSTEKQIRFITTLTTRARRPREVDNVDYKFVSKETFEDLLKKNELLESAIVYGNWYGVPKQPVRDALKQGQDIVVKVDVQGAASIKKIVPEAVFIFLVPPSLSELKNRLKRRYTEKPHELELRLQTAPDEMKEVSKFDYAVVNENDKIERTIDIIKSIIAAEKCRVNPRNIDLP
jgi:guanylate kinase